MSDEGESKSMARKLLDSITEALDRLKTLLGAVVAITGGGLTLWHYVAPVPPDAPPAAAAVCYSVKVAPHDDKVAVSRARQGDMRWFDLNVNNSCPSPLFLDVEFKQVQGGIAIVPPGPGYTAPPGQQITERMPIPNLSLLNQEPQQLWIQVLVYKTQGHEMVLNQTYPITIEAG